MEVLLSQSGSIISKSTTDVTSSFLLTKEKNILLTLLYGNVDGKHKEVPLAPLPYKIEYSEVPNFYKSVRSTILAEKIPDDISIYIRVENCNLPPVVVPFTKKNQNTVEFILPSLRDLTGAPFRPLTDIPVQVVVSDTRLRTTSPMRVNFPGLLAEVSKVNSSQQLLRFQSITAAPSLKYLLSNPDFSKLLNERDMYGSIPLHYAVIARNVDSIKILVEHSSEVNFINNDGYTPLDISNLLSIELPTIPVTCLSCPKSIPLNQIEEHSSSCLEVLKFKVEENRQETPRIDTMRFEPIVDQWIEKPKSQKAEVKTKRRSDQYLGHHEPPMKKFNAVEFDRFPLTQTMGTQIEKFKEAVLSNATAALKEYNKMNKKESNFQALNFLIVNANGQVISAGKDIVGEAYIRICIPTRIGSKYKLVTEDPPDDESELIPIKISAKYVILDASLHEIFATKNLDLKITKEDEECMDIRISSESLRTPAALIQQAKSEGIEVPAKNIRNLKLTLETPEFEAEKTALIEWGDKITNAALPISTEEYPSSDSDGDLGLSALTQATSIRSPIVAPKMTPEKFNQNIITAEVPELEDLAAMVLQNPATSPAKIEYIRYVEGPVRNSTQIKCRNFDPPVALQVFYQPLSEDVIFIYFRCPSDLTKDVLLTTIPVVSHNNNNKILIKRMKVNNNQLPGKVKGAKYFLDFELKRNGTLLQRLTSPQFFMDTHGRTKPGDPEEPKEERPRPTASPIVNKEQFLQ